MIENQMVKKMANDIETGAYMGGGGVVWVLGLRVSYDHAVFFMGRFGF